MADPIEVITAAQLASYPGVGYTAEQVQPLVDLTNRLITEEWSTPVTPIPVKVELLALEVAGRAARNPKGLASWTISVDDATKTERLPETAARAGVYLTASDERILSGRGTRSRFGTVRTRPGY